MFYNSTMLITILRIIDFVFPPHPAIKILRPLTPKNFAELAKIDHFPHLVTLAHYQNPSIKAAITANKFHDHKPASRLLAGLLHQYLSSLPYFPTLLIPIPLAKEREQKRGYNQVTRVIKNLDHFPALPFPVKTIPFLSKTKNTPPQTSLKRHDRLHNLDHAFAFQAVHSDFSLDDLSKYRIFIVDDVMTTGSTLKSAYAELKPHFPASAPLACIALAH